MSRSEKPTKPETPASPPPSNEEAMRESLEELAQNVDVLVDRLTMDMTDTPLGDTKKPAPAATPPTPAEDPSEVAALAESKPAAKTRSKAKAKAKTKAKPDAETFSTESLSEATSPAQYSEMIDAELDKMFGKYESGNSKVKAKQASAETKAAKTVAPAPVEKQPPPKETAEAAKPVPAPPATPKAKPAPAPAPAATAAAKAPAREVVIPWSDVREPARHPGGRMWMIAAGVLVVGAIAVGFWFMFSPGDRSSGAGPIAGTTGPGQEPGAATTQGGGVNLATPFDMGQWEPTVERSETATTDDPPVDTPEVPATDTVTETTAEPMTATARPAAKPPVPEPAKTEPAPPVKKIATTKPVEKPEPKPARVTAPAPPPAAPERKPEPKPEPEPEPKRAPAPPVETTPAPEAAVAPVKEPEPGETTKPPAESPEVPRPALDRSIPAEPPRLAEAPPPTPPAETVAEPVAGTVGPEAASMAPTGEITPPELVSRQEPRLTERERKRGKSGVVVLRVLVNDRGRVVRVIIEDPTQGTAFEARAIDSALRSVYRPAMQDGEPVEAWVTERFAFVP
jgi:TonB family protein